MRSFAYGERERRNMKKLILWMVLWLCLTGCSRYLSQEEGYWIFFAAEETVTTGLAYTPLTYIPLESEQDKLPEALLEQLLMISSEGAGNTAFPHGTMIEKLSISENQVATITFTSHYRELTGISRVLADYSVVLTLTQLPEISGVDIRTSGGFYLEEEEKILRPEDVIFATMEEGGTE